MPGWQLLPTPTGGTVAGLASTGAQVFAATRAGVWRSSDAAITWRAADGAAIVPLTEAVAITDHSVFVAAADGLYRSIDGGARWQPVLGAARVLCVAARGQVVLAGTEADGLVRSDDGGRTWTGANAGMTDPTVLAAALSPTFDADGIAFVGTPSGLFRTRNAARAWRYVETAIGDVAVQSIAVGPDRVVLTGTESDGLLRSDDGGSTWHAAPDFEGRSVAAIAFAPVTKGLVALATDASFAISRDHGRTWRAHAPPAAPVLALTFAGDVLLAGLANDGVARSTDAGQSWSLANDGLCARLYVALALLPDSTPYLADAENGVFGVTAAGELLYATRADGLYRSDDAGVHWEPVYHGMPLRALACAPGGDRLIAATEDGALAASNDRGAKWTALPSSPGAALSVALSPDTTLWVVTRGATWRSSDGGRQWRQLTNVPPDTTSLAILDDRSVLAGASSGVSISRDAGEHFVALEPGPTNVVAVAYGEERVFALGLGGQLWRRQLSL